MGILLTILYTALFIFLIYTLGFFRDSGISRRSLTIVFILKILSGFVMFVVYTKYYPDRQTADIFKYYDDSEHIIEALPDAPWDYVRMVTGIGENSSDLEKYYVKMNHWHQEYESNLYNDSHIIIRFNAIARLFSFGVFHVHTIIMCFLSLFGLVALYRAFIPFFRNRLGVLFIGVFLLPSVIFWGSGVLKEGLLIFFMGMMIYHFFKTCSSKISFWSVFWIAASTFMMFYLKFYVLAMLIPGLIAWFWTSMTSNRKLVLKFVIVYFAYLGCSFLVKYGIPEYDPYWIIYVKQRDFLGLAQEMQSGSMVPYLKLSSDPLNILFAVPHSLFIVFIYPHIFQPFSALNFVAAVENLFLSGMIVFVLIFRQKWKNIPIKPLLFAICFVLGLYALTGLTTPVAGAIVRYKVPALPFLLIACSSMLDIDRLGKKFPWLRKLLQ
ncbi:MAG: hypothetical protein KKA07_07375 [Bacteroidetes bacterium]|nr:hypothetical protein [Bacteroidota bacterium]MBU1718881.1 hypothetical protein [Bacteroidota bacterium]